MADCGPLVSTLYPAGTSSDVSVQKLYDRLDDLWQSYLLHLEEYTMAQKLIQNHMSAGFLSLARANFTARDGIRRYGKDFYHDKATASNRIQYSFPSGNERQIIRIAKWAATDPDEDNASSSARSMSDAEDKEAKQQPSPPATPAPDTDDVKVDIAGKTNGDKLVKINDGNADIGTERSSSTEKPPAKIALSMDPLRWFGILVPPDLRSAQTSFLSIVEDPISDAVNAARAMRETEADIRKLRKEIKRAGKTGS